MCKAWKNPQKKVTVALVGKYIQLHDAYISVVEALKHGGVYNSADVTIKWVDSDWLRKKTQPNCFQMYPVSLFRVDLVTVVLKERFRQSVMQEKIKFHF